MGSVAGDVFAYALAAGLSATAFLATVIVLATQRGTANALALLVGVWVVLAPAMVGAAWVSDLVTGAGGNQVVVSLVQLALGLMLLRAAWSLRPRRADGPDIGAKLAGMSAKAQALEPSTALRLGIGVAVLPKRLIITLLAGAAVGAAVVSPAQGLILVVLFVLVATVLIWGTLVAFVVGGERSRAALESGRQWVEANVEVLALAVTFVFGVLFTGQGLLGLLGD